LLFVAALGHRGWPSANDGWCLPASAAGGASTSSSYNRSQPSSDDWLLHLHVRRT
jgi:hypothetical protein